MADKGKLTSRRKAVLQGFNGLPPGVKECLGPPTEFFSIL
jgi:hypothetical protein